MSEQLTGRQEMLIFLIITAVSYAVLAVIGLAIGNRDLVILSLAFGGASIPAVLGAFLLDRLFGGDEQASTVVMGISSTVLFFSFGLLLLKIIGSLLPAWQLILLLVAALFLVAGVERAFRRAKSKNQQDE